MEVEGPTDGAVAVWGAAGMAAGGSTDMGAASAGEQAGRAGRGSAGQHRAGRMEGMSRNQRQRLKKLARRGRDG